MVWKLITFKGQLHLQQPRSTGKPSTEFTYMRESVTQTLLNNINEKKVALSQGTGLQSHQGAYCCCLDHYYIYRT